MDTLLFVLVFLAVCFLLWALLQGALLRGACAIFNGMAGRSGGPSTGVPELGLWKATGIVFLALAANALISWVLLLMFRNVPDNADSVGAGQVVTAAVGLPVSLLVAAGLLMLLLPAPLNRSFMVSLIWVGLYLLVSFLFGLLLKLLFVVNGPWMPGDQPPYGAVEWVIFGAVALLLEVPVFYASTALSGSEPSLLKTFLVPVLTAAVWGAGAAAAVWWLTPAWLKAPEHLSSLIGLIAVVVFVSLLVQAVSFTLLVPTSVFGGVLTSVFQLLLRILLYVLLMAVNFVFLGILQILRGPPPEKSAALLAPILDVLALLA